MNIKSFFRNLFGLQKETVEELMKKFLIVGLGNIGDKSDISKIETLKKEWSPRKIIQQSATKSLLKLKDN